MPPCLYVVCDAILLAGSLLTNLLRYQVWVPRCLQEEISYDAVLLMDCLLSHPGAVTDVMLLPTTCVACLLIIMQQTCSMEQMPSKQHLEHVPGAVAEAGALPCSAQPAAGSWTAMRSPWLPHIAAGGLVHSKEQMLSVGLTAAYLLERAQPSALFESLLLAGKYFLFVPVLAVLSEALPYMAAGLQIDSLVDVQAKVLSVLHHDTAAISAVRCLKLFLERLGCAFGEGDEAEVSTKGPLSASGSYLWHTAGGASRSPRRCSGLSSSGDHPSIQSPRCWPWWQVTLTFTTQPASTT